MECDVPLSNQASEGGMRGEAAVARCRRRRRRGGSTDMRRVTNSPEGTPTGQRRRQRAPLTSQSHGAAASVVSCFITIYNSYDFTTVVPTLTDEKYFSIYSYISTFINWKCFVFLNKYSKIIINHCFLWM